MLTPDEKLCARCRKPAVRLGAKWPEGRVCRRCYQRAARTHGTCPGCGTKRLLPGLDDTGSPVCVECAGIPADFHCTQCSAEEEPYRARRCARCCLQDHLAELLDDGTGTVSETLRPLHEGISAQPHPRSALTWLRNPDVRDLLATIATGVRPLAHATIDAHRSPRTAMHLRELFIEHGILEPIDRNLLHFETWLDRILAELTNPDHHALIKQFATWHHLRRMRQLSAAGELNWGTARAAKQDISVAKDFLGHLSDRGKLPSQCRQEDIDHWIATGPTTRSTARTFVRWAVRNQHLPRVDFPYRKANSRPVLDQNERLRLLRETLDNHHIPLHHRAAAVLLLLYAQPLTRIASMQCEQITRTDHGETVVVFDDQPVPVPHPFDEILQEHLADRPNMNTAANRASAWLFPGYRPGQHLHPGHLMKKLRESGIHLLGARNATLRALVLTMPPPVAAHALGYSTQITEQHAKQAGNNWATYASYRR
jgi:hypothetical protein